MNQATIGRSSVVSRSLILTCLFLHWGCAMTGFFPLKDDEKMEGRPRDDEDIRIILLNGTHIEAEAGLHVVVDKPSDFILGIGKRHKHNTDPSDFTGTLMRSSVDSCKTIGSGDEQRLKCWLPDSSFIIFNNGNYVATTPDMVNGYLCKHGFIPFESIKQVEVKKPDGLRIGIYSLALVALVGSIIFAAGWGKGWDLSGL